MSKEFLEFTIQNAKELISKVTDENPDISADDYKLRKLKNNENYILTKKDFNKYSQDFDVRLVGQIKKGQIHYKSYDNEDELKKEKRKKKIIGKTRLLLSANAKKYDYKETVGDKNNKYKYYDIKKPGNSKHIYGYAWVGGNKFLEVVDFNLLILLIPIILACIIAVTFTSCPGDSPIQLPWADTSDVSDDDNASGEQLDSSLCYFYPFSSITLTENSKNIRLMNLKVNEKFYISYEVYVDGERIQLRDVTDDEDPENAYTTGLITPGQQVNFDLWDRLDAGTYDLTYYATEYDYDNPTTVVGTCSLPTTLVVDK